MTNPRPLYLTPSEAEAARDTAWDQFLMEPHANPRVGKERYHAKLKAIAMLERDDG